MKLITITLLATALMASVVQAGSEVGEITLDELKQAVASNLVTLIDVNGTDSYKSGHIPGAIDFEASKDELASKLPAEKDALIVAYCGGPACGAYKKGATAAMELGYTNVKHYKGGLSGWKEAGEELAKAE
jgi:rhodanese-related sulfurtransferase